MTVEQVPNGQIPAPVFEPGMPGYVLRDWEVTDYQCYQLSGTETWFRGPAPTEEVLKGGKYISAIGAAQTFGCFCDQPYPNLLAERLKRPVVNLGYSGSGPSFYLNRPDLLDVINRGSLCIVQVMSGRSSRNSAFANPDGVAHGTRIADGTPCTAEDVFDDAIASGFLAWRLPMPRRYRNALVRRLGLPLADVTRLASESRRNWVADMRSLLSRISVPTVLFWFSKREPEYVSSPYSTPKLLGGFPHLIDKATLDPTKTSASKYVECVTSRGSPQPLISRFTGEPVEVNLTNDLKPTSGGREVNRLYEGTWTANKYYPSPEMHEDAANALEPACRSLLGVTK